MIDNITKQKILDAARIEEVVGDFVTLKRAGVNLKGLCPFHDDRTPSFIVSPAKNYCKCFACGKGGNPVGFIMEHEQLSYPDALRWLAKKYGITVEEKEMTDDERAMRNDNESMYILNEWARDWFTHQLYDTEDGRAIGLAYFRGRGFRDDILKKFQVGYCPNQRDVSMSEDALKAGYQEKYLINTPDERDTRKSIGTGLSFKNEKSGNRLRDRFFGRVMWPIFTVGGKVAGFGGRVLDAATKGVNMKYQNSPESSIYSKRRELYGLFQAKQAIVKQDECYLVEGYTDVMAMHQSGVENVVASSGTALTDEQIRLIHRFTENIVVIYDGDAAGIKASQRGIDMLLGQGMNVKLLLLPDGDDPDSFSRKHNATEFQAYLNEHRVDFIRFKTDLLLQEAQGDPVKLSHLINNIVQSISVIPDEIKRSLYIRETAQTMQMTERLIEGAVAKQRQKLREEWMRQKERERNLAAGKPMPELPPEPTPEDWEPAISAEEMTAAQQSTLTATTAAPAPTLEQQQLTQKEQHEQMLFYQKEVLLIQAVIRYGEVMIAYNDANGELKTQTVAEYVDRCLRQDALEMKTELHRQVLQEAVAHVHDEGFASERFFLNHIDNRMSSLAFELSTEKEQLSKLYTTDKGNDVNVNEMVPRLINDYMLSVINELKKQIMLRIKTDKEHVMEIMKELKELKKIESELAKACGDRVIF